MDDFAPFFFVVAIMLGLGAFGIGSSVAEKRAVDNCVEILQDFSHKEIKHYCNKIVLNKDPQ